MAEKVTKAVIKAERDSLALAGLKSWAVDHD
jgi:hypothetical protein